MPPPKKLPRHEPPAQTTTNKAKPATPTTSDQPEPMTTDQPKPKRLHQSRQTDVKVGSLYDIDAIRQLGKGTNRRLICLLRYRLATNQQPHHQEWYALYHEPEHMMIHVSSDCEPGEHHTFYWKGRRTEFNKGSPVNNAAAEIDKLNDDRLKYVLPLDYWRSSTPDLSSRSTETILPRYQCLIFTWIIENFCEITFTGRLNWP